MPSNTIEQVDTNKTDHIVDILSKDNNRDIALIQRMCEGDMSAFEQVYYRWNKQVYAFMLKTCFFIIHFPWKGVFSGQSPL